jgi:hypothetical protein
MNWTPPSREFADHARYYTRALSATKRETNNKVVEMLIEGGGKISAPSRVTTYIVIWRKPLT